MSDTEHAFPMTSTERKLEQQRKKKKNPQAPTTGPVEPRKKQKNRREGTKADSPKKGRDSKETNILNSARRKKAETLLATYGAQRQQKGRGTKNENRQKAYETPEQIAEREPHTPGV